MKKLRRLKISLLLILTILAMNSVTLFKACRTLKFEKTQEVVTENVTITAEPTKKLEATEEQTIDEKDYDSDIEFQMLCMLTYGEAAKESMEGQIAVSAVVKNREESLEFPNTFNEVINQKNQFSTVKNGEFYLGRKLLSYDDIPEETVEAVQRALNGEDPTEELLWNEAVRLGLDPVKYAEGGALYFYNPNYCSEKGLKARENIKVKVRIGNHIFYKVWDK